MTDAPIRVLLAKVGLDGHDRGIKVVARALRDGGMEVIYTGLWQTPDAVARAAEEEDVDLVGVSMLSAAHMTLVPQILDRLRCGDQPRVPLVVGGIVPDDDAERLCDLGVSAVIGPESSLAAITETVRSLARQRRSLPETDWAASWRTELARSLSHLRASASIGNQHKAYWVGITGPPGVGKSTLIGRLIEAIRARGQKIAVLAVDPSSPISGGALLGDRARMREPADDPDVFVRSVAARGHTGGLARDLPAMLMEIDRHGFDIVLIETVGSGQGDHEVCKLADVTLLLLMPGAGDGLQLEKAGVIEVADILVVNKADRPESEMLLADARNTLGADRTLVKVSALRNEGIEQLLDTILAKR